MSDVIAPVVHKMFSNTQILRQDSNLEFLAPEKEKSRDIFIQEKEFNDHLHPSVPTNVDAPDVVQNTSYVENIANTVSNLAVEYESIGKRLSSKVEGMQTVDSKTLLTLQVDLLTFSVSQDLLAKFTSKGVQIIDTLMRNN